jgi:hypothetical protein
MVFEGGPFDKLAQDHAPPSPAFCKPIESRERRGIDPGGEHPFFGTAVCGHVIRFPMGTIGNVIQNTPFGLSCITTNHNTKNINNKDTVL